MGNTATKAPATEEEKVVYGPDGNKIGGRGRSQRKGRGRSQRKGRGRGRSHSISQRKGRGRGRGRSHRSH